MAATTLELLLKRDRLVILASLVAIIILAWLYLFYLAAGMETMDGVVGRLMGMPQMDAGGQMRQPGLADKIVNALLLSSMWIVMMVGMMLPSAAPTVLLFAALERKLAAPPRPSRTWLFVSGYVAVWSGFSVVAAAAQTALSEVGQLSMQMALTSRVLGGVVLIAAGLYEFSPLKVRCLSHCRSPLEWIAHHRRPGRLGALRMGAGHGLYCVGCCWVLMLLLFVGGVMNLVWVAAIAAIVLAEKLLPRGPLFARLAGGALVVWGAVLIAAPLLHV